MTNADYGLSNLLPTTAPATWTKAVMVANAKRLPDGNAQNTLFVLRPLAEYPGIPKAYITRLVQIISISGRPEQKALAARIVNPATRSLVPENIPSYIMWWNEGIPS